MEKIWIKQYDSGVPAEINMNEYKSIPEIMENAYKAYGSKNSFHNMGKTFTYNELKNYSQRFGSFLQNDLGLKKGDRVALMMPNILQYPVSLFGLLDAGLIAVNVDSLLHLASR